jgi:hypothetical protein
MRNRDTKDKNNWMMRVKRISASKKPLQADSIASGGTAEEIIIPVFKKLKVWGIKLEITYAKKGERRKRPKLTAIGYR